MASRSIARTLVRGAALVGLLAASAPAGAQEPVYSPYVGDPIPRRVYWGDTHLHTVNSGDAFAHGARLTPEQAYRFARGETVTSSSGQPARLARPLDFLVVADHAEGLGVGMELYQGNPVLMSDPIARRWHDMMRAGGEQAAAAGREMPEALASGNLPAPLKDPAVAGPLMRSVWQRYTEEADRFDEPGRFTALIGYEWTSVPAGDNLHRVVVLRDGKERADQVLPFSALQSEDPAALWRWMARYEEKTGGRVLAIPHNGNLSNGRMFAPADFAGAPMAPETARVRAQREPLVEVTQIKGDGETHPYLSPDDEFAGFGKAGWDNGNLTLEAAKTPDMLAGEYARPALLAGLRLEALLGTNPFRFGMIGSTDAHTALTTAEEGNFFGKQVGTEPSPGRASKTTKRVGDLVRIGWQYQAAGRAAVWAPENTREALFDAMERKEVYATTGPRMVVRFFGGFGLEEGDAERPDFVETGYRKGVPMGGELAAAPGGASPRFMVLAQRDPIGANLDRIQIVKGWQGEAGEVHERIHDVAVSGGRPIGRDGRCREPVGSTVDLATASYSNRIGAPLLAAVWADPAFDPGERAFYYARVIEIPTPRWPAYDAVRFGVEMGPEVELVQQERAVTSPIWYNP